MSQNSDEVGEALSRGPIYHHPPSLHSGFLNEPRKENAVRCSECHGGNAPCYPDTTWNWPLNARCERCRELKLECDVHGKQVEAVDPKLGPFLNLSETHANRAERNLVHTKVSTAEIKEDLVSKNVPAFVGVNFGTWFSGISWTTGAKRAPHDINSYAISFIDTTNRPSHRLPTEVCLKKRSLDLVCGRDVRHQRGHLDDDSDVFRCIKLAFLDEAAPGSADSELLAEVRKMHKSALERLSKQGAGESLRYRSEFPSRNILMPEGTVVPLRELSEVRRLIEVYMSYMLDCFLSSVVKATGLRGQEVLSYLSRFECVIGVPAMWTAPMKDEMLAAARKVGLDHVHIEAEPVCALVALYSSSGPLVAASDVGLRQIVADVGMGTVDFCTTKLTQAKPMRFATLSPPQGSLLGGLRLRSLASSFLQQRLKPYVARYSETFSKSADTFHEGLMDSFDERLRTYHQGKEMILTHKASSLNLFSLHPTMFQNNQLVLSPTQVNKLLNKFLQPIIDAIHEQLRTLIRHSPPNDDSPIRLVLCGGFSLCPSIFEPLTTTFSSLEVLLGEQANSSIHAKGATLLAMDRASSSRARVKTSLAIESTHIAMNMASQAQLASPLPTTLSWLTVKGQGLPMSDGKEGEHLHCFEGWMTIFELGTSFDQQIYAYDRDPTHLANLTVNSDGVAHLDTIHIDFDEIDFNPSRDLSLDLKYTVNGLASYRIEFRVIIHETGSAIWWQLIIPRSGTFDSLSERSLTITLQPRPVLLSQERGC